MMWMTMVLGLALADMPDRQAVVGEKAPDFTLTDTQGASHTLSALKGKVVVLEWFNPDCPFVVAAHEGKGPLVKIGNEWHARDQVVWLAVNSGAPNKQGFGKDRNQQARVEWKLDHPVLLDPTGEVGKKYGATNTPQMVVIGADGKVGYYGALDNAPLGKLNGQSYRGYFADALTNVNNQQAAKPSETKAYGCSVKY